MPAVTGHANGYGTEIHTAQNTSVITALETNQLKTGRGKLASISIWNVGTGATVDVYDNASLNSGEIWQWVTADGKKDIALQMVFVNGLRIVTSGTAAPSVTVSWS